MRYLLTHLMLPALVLLLALPDASVAQRRSREGGDGGGTQGQAIPRGEAPSPAPAPAAAPAPAPIQPAARPAPPTRSRDSQETSAPAGARQRQGSSTVGTAVRRGSVPPPPPNTAVVAPVYYRSYWPWGFGGLGFGSYYGGWYGGFYDPYYSYYPYGGYGTYGYGQYGYPPSSYTYGLEGSLRLKVKPRNAQVYVDGYYVGIVDDFDGVWQRLHIEAGPHRIEVRAPGYEPLAFDVRVQFDDTTSLEGELKPIK